MHIYTTFTHYIAPHACSCLIAVRWLHFTVLRTLHTHTYTVIYPFVFDNSWPLRPHTFTPCPCYSSTRPHHAHYYVPSIVQPGVPLGYLGHAPCPRGGRTYHAPCPHTFPLDMPRPLPSWPQFQWDQGGLPMLLGCVGIQTLPSLCPFPTPLDMSTLVDLPIHFIHYTLQTTLVGWTWLVLPWTVYGHYTGQLPVLSSHLYIYHTGLHEHTHLHTLPHTHIYHSTCPIPFSDVNIVHLHTHTHLYYILHTFYLHCHTHHITHAHTLVTHKRLPHTRGGCPTQFLGWTTTHTHTHTRTHTFTHTLY